MSEYKLLFLKDLWSFKNNILDIKKNPKRLIIHIIQLFALSSILFNVYMRSKYDHTSQLQMTIGPQIIGAAFTILILVFFAYMIYKGTQESSTFFSMGDIHLLFPAPVSSKKILIYNMIRQSIVNFFLYGIFILFVGPSITNIAELDMEYLGYMYLGYISFVLLLEPLNFFIFAIGSKYNIQSLIRNIIFGFVGIFAVYIVVATVASQDIVQGFLESVNRPFINYIPIIGWTKAVFMTPIIGYKIYNTVALFMQIATILLFIVLSYWVADDYYEDVLLSTEKKDIRKKQRQGFAKSETKRFVFRKNKDLKVKKAGTGPWAFIWKTKVQYTRTDLHSYISIKTILFLLVAVGIGYFMRVRSSDMMLVYFINGMVAYVIFIMGATRIRDNELNKPYIYITPGNSFKKIVAITWIDIARMSINAIIFNLVLGYIIKASPITVLIMILFLISFYILNISSNFLLRVIFPDAIDQKMLLPLIHMLNVIVLLLPGVIAGVTIGIMMKNPLWGYLGVSIMNFIIIFILLTLGNEGFNRIELR